MELISTEMPRVFKFKYKNNLLTLSDIGPDRSAEDVKRFYATTYPILVTAKVVGPVIEEDKVVYRFLPTLGTKG